MNKNKINWRIKELHTYCTCGGEIYQETLKEGNGIRVICGECGTTLTLTFKEGFVDRVKDDWRCTFDE